MIASCKVMGFSNVFEESWVDDYIKNGKSVNDYTHKRFESFRERLTKD
jgi:hypothetical protein